ncbi:MAG TPA: SRPBCC family protein [Pyrinomonadaceae bacterium]|nr:SRPBCC family protein [Pyrinomonadaceae bacterium]
MATIEERLQSQGVDTEMFGERESAAAGGSTAVNVGQTERWASMIGGGALAAYGLTRGSLGGIALALAGAALLHRGYSGHCNLYEATGINTAGETNENVSVRADRGIRVERSTTINRPADELYRFWRDFENLPRFMSHLEEVRVMSETRSHWVAKAPAGTSVEWDAEVYNERANELIAWRTLEGADVASAGSVRFDEAPGGRGTVVRVVLRYDPPGGRLGAFVARLFGENPDQQIADDLSRFKQLMETGEVTTVEGQTSGRSDVVGG